MRIGRQRVASSAAVIALLLLGAAALALALAAAETGVAKMPGFSAQGAAAEIATEQSFRDAISASEIMKFHRYLTAEPHPAGSARNNDLAKWMAEQWREQGLEDVTIHEYDVLNSSPREISLEMIKPSTSAPACAKMLTTWTRTPAIRKWMAPIWDIPLPGK